MVYASMVKVAWFVASVLIVVTLAVAAFAAFVCPLFVVGLAVVAPQTAALFAVAVAVGAVVMGWMSLMGTHQYDVYHG